MSFLHLDLVIGPHAVDGSRRPTGTHQLIPAKWNRTNLIGIAPGSAVGLAAGIRHLLVMALDAGSMVSTRS